MTTTVTTDQWISTDFDDPIRNFTPFIRDMRQPHTYLNLDFEAIWISLALISIIVFTVGGNSLVCIAVLRERHLRSTTNYFLTSLAVTDCLVACLVMPLAVTVELIGHFPFDALACNVWLTFDVCCCTSSIWHMSVMSLDRYLTLRYPLKYGRNKRRSLVAYKIITIWLISFAICLPLFILGLVDTTNVYDEHTQACFPTHRTFKIYGSFVAFFIPLIIMIVTYALTMSALQQAHTTKQNHYKRRQRFHAVINLAAMAIRWKRAVNSVEIVDGKRQVVQADDRTVVQTDDQTIVVQQEPEETQVMTSKGSMLIHRHEEREKPLQPLSERSLEHLPIHHLNALLPSNPSTKRSHSCTRLGNEIRRSSRSEERSSSVHTLLQIRRHSAKISEELASLSAKLSASMNATRSASARPSLCVPGTERPNDDDDQDHRTPTIGQLLAKTRACASQEINHEDLSPPATHLPIPNLFITHDSLHNLSHSKKKTQHLSTITMDNTCQRIKDWITVTTSSTALNQDSSRPDQIRCASAMNITEQTPMLNGSTPVKQLYGQINGQNGLIRCAHQFLLVDDQVASAQMITRQTRPSIASIASSMMKARRSAQYVGTRANPHDRLSQMSFQMVSLDTDDSSSCSSSLTQRSISRQSATTIESTQTTTRKSVRKKKTSKFKHLAKHSTNNERKAMRVLLIIFSIFVLLWTPFFVINLLSCFMTDIHPIVISVATWLGYCSSCANPIIYTIFSRAFRRAFINILTCQKVIRSHRPSSRQSVTMSTKRKTLRDQS